MSSDRDRLIELIKNAPTTDTVYGNIKLQTPIQTVQTIADHLLANGVIVQKQGEWKKTEEPLGWQDVDCVECSACHETWILDEDFDFEFCKEVWHYCPNCGAKIKECEGK